MTDDDDEVRFLAALLTMRPGETMADRLTEFLSAEAMPTISQPTPPSLLASSTMAFMLLVLAER